MTQYLRESDVTVTEETDTLEGDGKVQTLTSKWVARAEGRLYDEADPFPGMLKRGGAMIEMERSGETASQAMMALRHAAEKQGWEIRNYG